MPSKNPITPASVAGTLCRRAAANKPAPPAFAMKSGMTVMPRRCSKASADGATGALAASTIRRACTCPACWPSIAWAMAAGINGSTGSAAHSTPGRLSVPGGRRFWSMTPNGPECSANQERGILELKRIRAPRHPLPPRWPPACSKKRAVLPPTVPNPWMAAVASCKWIPKEAEAWRVAWATS